MLPRGPRDFKTWPGALLVGRQAQVDGHGHTRTLTLEGWRIAPAGEGAEGIGGLGFGIWFFGADLLGSLHRLESLCHQKRVPTGGCSVGFEIWGL